MNGGTASESDPGALGATSPTIERAFGQVRRGDLALAFELAALLTCAHTFNLVPLLSALAPAEAADFVARHFLESVVLCELLVVLLRIAERANAAGWRRHLLTIGVGVLPTLAGLPLYLLEWPFASAGLRYGTASSPLALILYVAWQYAMLALGVRAWLLYGDETQQATRLLGRLVAEQATARKRLVEARLSALQARVEPALLFDVLDSVGQRYAVDTERGEALLDELTGFLRSSLPTPAASTLAGEVALVISQARLKRHAGLAGPIVSARIDPAVRDAPFPSGVLLPLAVSFAEGKSRFIEVTATRSVASTEPRFAGAASGADLLLTIRGTAPLVPAALQSVRATLRDLFGQRSELSALEQGRHVAVSLRLPYELA